MNSDPLYEQAIRDVERLEADNGVLQARVRELEAQVALWARAFNTQPTDNPGDVAVRFGSRLSRAEQAVARLREALKDVLFLPGALAGGTVQQFKKAVEDVVENARAALAAS